jgi:hypothetical protein
MGTRSSSVFSVPRGPFPRRSRRISPYTIAPVQDGDSVDALNITGVSDEEYCPSPPEVQGHDSEEDSEDEGQHCRKRRRVSRSALAPTLGSSPASGCSRNNMVDKMRHAAI